MGNWGEWEETEELGRGFSKVGSSLEVFISRFCGTIELSTGLVAGHNSGCP